MTICSTADSISRTDESYLELVTREHQLFKHESKVMKDLMQQENLERDLFSTFSQNLRDCQEVGLHRYIRTMSSFAVLNLQVERMRQERTKYLSLLGSLIGAALGIIGTSINHALKNRDFKKILQAIEVQSQQIQLQSEQLVFNHEQKIQPIEEGHSETVIHINEKPEEKVDDAVIKRIQESEVCLRHQMNFNSLATVGATYLLIVVTLSFMMKIIGD